jgi:hypothetical protein
MSILPAFMALAACAPSNPPPTTALVPPAASAEPAVQSAPPASSGSTPAAGGPGATEAKRDPRFPAGRGATLVSDQLHEALRDAVVRDAKRPLADRVAAAAKVLGDPGTPDGNTHVWYAVFGRNVMAPFGCRELRIGERMVEGPSDFKNCGLPYANIAPGDHYSGPGARWTSVRLDKELKLQASNPSAPSGVKSLGQPDKQTADEAVWLGVGPRDEKAPLTCWALTVGKTATLAKVPLSDCAIVWPPPATAFDAGPVHPPALVAPLLAECKAQCKTNEICLLDRRVARAASLVPREDGSLSARYMDGRSAKVELVRSCAPVPATCAKPSGTCWWKGPADLTAAPDAQLGPTKVQAGPCPADTYRGHSFADAKGDASAHVMCFSQLK